MSGEIFKSNHQIDLTVANRDGKKMGYQAVVNSLVNEEVLKSFSVNVMASDINKIKDFKLIFLASRTNLKGFRPGKAPLNVVWMQHQTELMNEIANDTINEATNALVNALKNGLIMAPQINLKNFSLEQGLEFEVTMNLMPIFDMPEVKGIALEKLTYEITEDDIKDRVKELMKHHKDYTKAKEGYKAASGDKVVIDFEGKIDGVVFPGGAAKGHTLELGSKSFIDNFEDQLLKHKAGDEILVKVTFPNNYHNAEFAGKAAEFTVTIHEIQQAKNCESAEEFAKNVKFSSVEEMNTRVKEALERECSEKVHIQMKIDLFDKLDSACNFTLPQIMIDQEFDQLWKNVEVMLKNKQVDKSETELREEYLKLAKRRVKLGILLSEMAKKYSVKVEQQDIIEAVRVQAMANPAAAQAIIKYYTENKNALETLKGPIVEEKVVHHLFSEIKTTEKSIKVKKLLELARA